jgi:hypothetical protein
MPNVKGRGLQPTGGLELTWTNDRANDPDVLEKTAGFEWARFANDSGDGTATWHYLFATETALKQAGAGIS